MGFFDAITGAAGKVANTVGGAANSLGKGIKSGVSKLADTAADEAADAALAPLNLIEKSLDSVAGLAPSIVAKRRDAINTMLSGIEDAALKHDDEVAKKRMDEAVATVTARIKEIRVDTSVPKEIKDKYELILDDLEASPEDLINALANADDDLLVYENKEFNGWRLVKRAWRFASDYIYYILLFICALFGGIIMSNVYINETFLPIRVYYFFYGTAFFPVSLLYGIVNPPEWNATLFPVYRIIDNRRALPVANMVGAMPARMVGGATPIDTAHGTGIGAGHRTTVQGPAADALAQATAKGESDVQAAQDAIKQLEVAGVPEAAAKQQVVAALEAKGVPAVAAVRAVSAPIIAPKPLTLTQRMTMLQNELFGYKAGGSTLVMRIISAILAATISIWAYYRGDLDDLIDTFRKKTGTDKVLPAEKNRRRRVNTPIV